MIFYSSVNVLACDNGPCEISAVLSGYSSVTQYMVTQIVAWTLTIFLSFPVTSPILLRMINFAVSCGNGPLELFMALLCCPLAYMWSYTCGGLIWGSIVALVQILGALICFFLVWRNLVASHTVRIDLDLDIIPWWSQVIFLNLLSFIIQENKSITRKPGLGYVPTNSFTLKSSLTGSWANCIESRSYSHPQGSCCEEYLCDKTSTCSQRRPK